MGIYTQAQFPIHTPSFSLSQPSGPYLVKGTEIIVPEKALVFKWYCAWSCEIKQNNTSDEKWYKSLIIFDYRVESKWRI